MNLFGSRVAQARSTKVSATGQDPPDRSSPGRCTSAEGNATENQLLTVRER
jgi:hypothetical protein